MALALSARERDAVEATRRDHMRAMTTARQAAERCYATRSPRLGSHQEASTAFRAELTRIDTEHQAWMRVHVEDVPQEARVHGPQRRRATI